MDSSNSYEFLQMTKIYAVDKLFIFLPMFTKHKLIEFFY